MLLSFALGLGVLPTSLAWALVYQDAWECYRLVRDGVEADAVAIDLGESRRLVRRRRSMFRSSTKYSFYTTVRYDGYTGLIRLPIREDAVRVIYPADSGPPAEPISQTDAQGRVQTVFLIDHELVFVGKKSEGFLAIYRRHYGISRLLFFLFVNTVLAGLSLRLGIRSLGSRRV